MGATPESIDQARGLKLQLNPSYYTPESRELMQARGIIRDDETLEGALGRTVSALLEIDTKLADGADQAFQAEVIDLVNDGTLIFGTPVLTNAGLQEKVTAACTVLPVRANQGRVDINHFTSESFAALDGAIGTGYDLSDLNDPTSALIELNEVLDKINSQLLANHQRPVASMATLRANHPDVMSFIRSKREADFSAWRFNISLFVDQSLFAAAAANLPWALKDADGQIVDSINALDLLAEIASCAHYCGEPGILFKDRIDNDNPTPQWEYKSTAPCAEVAMAEGEACQFSYINLANIVDSQGHFDIVKFGRAVEVMTRLLDASVEHTIQEGNGLALSLVKEKRRIGVGITGFADLLTQLRIPYDRPEAAHLAAQISELLDYHSKTASLRLAQVRGVFPAYQQSRYLEPDWLRRKSLDATGAIDAVLWEELYSNIEQYGVRHASTTSMPPTGTSSAIVGASKSLEPHFALTDHIGRPIRPVAEMLSTEQLTPKVVGELCVANAMLSEESLAIHPYLRTARQLDTNSHLAIQASFQRFLDESLAKTINLNNDASVDDVFNVLWAAYHNNLKGITVFRDGCLAERLVAADHVA